MKRRRESKDDVVCLIDDLWYYIRVFVRLLQYQAEWLALCQLSASHHYVMCGERIEFPCYNETPLEEVRIAHRLVGLLWNRSGRLFGAKVYYVKLVNDHNPFYDWLFCFYHEPLIILNLDLCETDKDRPQGQWYRELTSVNELPMGKYVLSEEAALFYRQVVGEWDGRRKTIGNHNALVSPLVQAPKLT